MVLNEVVGQAEQLKPQEDILKWHISEEERALLSKVLFERIDPAILERSERDLLRERDRIKHHAPGCGDCAKRIKGMCESQEYRRGELVDVRESVDHDEPICLRFRRPSKTVERRRFARKADAL